MTLVFAIAFCYTGAGTKMSSPCAQIMAESDKPRYQQDEDIHKQKQMSIHDIPFSYSCEGLSNRKYIICR